MIAEMRDSDNATGDDSTKTSFRKYDQTRGISGKRLQITEHEGSKQNGFDLVAQR